MANTTFTRALAATLTHEGGYANDPADPGGETYRGISRRFHQAWPGWDIIDAHRHSPDFPACLDTIPVLNDQVAEFYRVQYWDRLSGDELALLAPSLAARLFDMAVNLGVHRAAIMLQQALNALNRNGKTWPDLACDGQIGPATLAAVKRYADTERTDTLLLNTLRIIHGHHYLKTMRQHPTLEKYARGWLARAMS